MSFCPVGVQFVLRTFSLSYGRSICPTDVHLSYGRCLTEDRFNELQELALEAVDLEMMP